MIPYRLRFFTVQIYLLRLDARQTVPMTATSVFLVQHLSFTTNEKYYQIAR